MRPCPKYQKISLRESGSGGVFLYQNLEKKYGSIPAAQEDQERSKLVVDGRPYGKKVVNYGERS